ncbi:hypothetical protein THAOC_15186, partial [Thalassiosira oceanica]
PTAAPRPDELTFSLPRKPRTDFGAETGHVADTHTSPEQVPISISPSEQRHGGGNGDQVEGRFGALTHPNTQQLRGIRRRRRKGNHGAAGLRRQQQRLGLGRLGPRGGEARPGSVARPGEEEEEEARIGQEGEGWQVQGTAAAEEEEEGGRAHRRRGPNAHARTAYCGEVSFPDSVRESNYKRGSAQLSQDALITPFARFISFWTARTARVTPAGQKLCSLRLSSRRLAAPPASAPLHRLSTPLRSAPGLVLGEMPSTICQDARLEMFFVILTGRSKLNSTPRGTEKEETASDHGAAGLRRQQQRLGLGRRGPRGGGARPEVARPGEEEARPTKKKKDGTSGSTGRRRRCLLVVIWLNTLSFLSSFTIHLLPLTEVIIDWSYPR